MTEPKDRKTRRLLLSSLRIRCEDLEADNRHLKESVEKLKDECDSISSKLIDLHIQLSKSKARNLKRIESIRSFLYHLNMREEFGLVNSNDLEFMVQMYDQQQKEIDLLNQKIRLMDEEVKGEYLDTRTGEWKSGVQNYSSSVED